MGVNALDYSGYPDCRPEYLAAFQAMADLAQKRAVEGRPVRIEAPLIEMTKADIIRRGVQLGVPFELSWSCYEGSDHPCGECDSCVLRAKGFEEAGLSDPALAEVSI
jgi:7-cyano-7-deazaguanine synthase